MERSQLQEMLDKKLAMRDSLDEDLSLKNISLPDYRKSIARLGKVLLEELSGKLSKVEFNEKCWCYRHNDYCFVNPRHSGGDLENAV